MIKKLFLGLLIAIAAVALWEFATFPDVTKLADERPETTAFMEQRKEELREKGKSDELSYRWVSYERISPYLRRAVLISEDNSFYEHEGVDEKGLKEALKRNWEEKKIAAGGSTITQQLAKNLYLSPSKNPYRKVKELLITRALERELSKKRILELYLNVVELGERTYGAEAAAREYFDKPASALTPREAALLAAALPNPRLMNPAKPNKRLKRRQRIILSRMRRWGYALEKEVLSSKPKKEEKEEAPVAAPPQTASEPVGIDTSVPEDVEESDSSPDTATAPQEEPPAVAQPPAETPQAEPPAEPPPPPASGTP